MGLLSSIGGVIGGAASSLGNFLNKGGGTFKDPFLSIKGQEERLGNTVNTLASAFNPLGKGVSVNRNIVKNEAVAKTLETIASHPYVSAAVVAGGVMAAKRAIPAVAKILGGGAAKTAAGGVIAAGGGATAVIPKVSGILAGNKSVPATLQADKNIDITNNSNLKDTVVQAVLAQKDNKTILAAASSLTNSVGGSKIKRSRSTTRVKHKKKRSHKSKARKHHRKLKFGSAAFRKKYLHHHKRSKKHKKNRHLPKFGSPAWRKKFHLDKHRRKKRK
jgi:hypothetical protein